MKAHHFKSASQYEDINNIFPAGVRSKVDYWIKFLDKLCKA